MPARLPLTSQRLVVVTGKGGVGKTAVAAALARAAVAANRRVLAVEVGRGRLGALLGAARGGLEPRPVSPGLAMATVEPEDALGDFVHGVLRIRMLSRRLLESTSFQVLAAAAPGLPEFLVLQKLQAWLDARRLGRTVYDLIVVDAPASGHSLPLLAAPRTLGALARLGPVGDTLRVIGATLADPATTLVCLVTHAGGAGGTRDDRAAPRDRASTRPAGRTGHRERRAAAPLHPRRRGADRQARGERRAASVARRGPLPCSTAGARPSCRCRPCDARSAPLPCACRSSSPGPRRRAASIPSRATLTHAGLAA